MRSLAIEGTGLLTEASSRSYSLINQSIDSKLSTNKLSSKFETLV